MDKKRQICFVSPREKAQQVESLLSVVVNFVPGMCLFQSVFSKLDDAYRLELMFIISAVEVSLALSNGVVLLAQPNTFGFECFVVASALMRRALFFVGNDRFTSQTVKVLAEKVAAQESVVVVLDSLSCEVDPQWVQFACAVASGDKTFIRSRLNIADLRQFVSQVQE